MADSTCETRSLEGVIRGSNFSIAIDGDVPLALVRAFSLNFQRKLQRQYDLASPSFYYVEGPAEGGLSLQHVVGPKGVPKLYCDCVPKTIVLKTGDVSCFRTSTQVPAVDATYTMSDALPFGLQGQGSIDDWLIIFNISYLFGSLS